MNLFSHLPILVFFLITLIASACAQDKTIDPKHVAELKQIYKEFDESGKKRDMKTIEKYLDDNYELQKGNTKTSRADVIKGVEAFYAMLEEITEVVSKIEKINLVDGNYFLEVSSVIKGKIKMPDGKVVSFETTSKSTDSWTKTNAGWRETAQIVREREIFIDGEKLFVN